MVKQTKRSGILARSARVAKRVGGFYLWTVAGDLQERKDDFRRIKQSIENILNRQFRHESFDEAVIRLRLRDDDLKKRADYLASLGFLFGMISLIAFGFLLAAPFSPSPINHALMSAGVSFVAGTRFISIRFRVAQIRRRTFFEFKDWFLRREGTR